MTTVDRWFAAPRRPRDVVPDGSLDGSQESLAPTRIKPVMDGPLTLDGRVRQTLTWPGHAGQRRQDASSASSSLEGRKEPVHADLCLPRQLTDQGLKNFRDTVAGPRTTVAWSSGTAAGFACCCGRLVSATWSWWPISPTTRRAPPSAADRCPWQHPDHDHDGVRCRADKRHHPANRLRPPPADPDPGIKDLRWTTGMAGAGSPTQCSCSGSPPLQGQRYC